MKSLTRKTRRLAAKWGMTLITAVFVWMVMPGDIGPNEMALAIAFIPSLVALIGTFIIGETLSDNSARKYKDKHDDV